MKYATTANFRDNLSAYLRDVEAGERITVLRRNRPIAEFGPPRPPTGEEPAEEARLQALERAGVIVRGSGRLPDWFFDELRRSTPAAAVEALLAERREGR